MKLCAFILFGLFFATVVSSAQKSLQDDFEDFIALIPVSKLKEIVCYYKNDPEVQLLINYLRSDEFSDLVTEIRKKEEWKDFKNYVNEAGVNIEKLIALIYDFITRSFCGDASANSRSLNDLLEELKAALPVDEIKALFYDKLQNSADFSDFVSAISNVKCRQLFEKVIALEEFLRIIAKLEELGFGMKQLKDVI